MSHGDREMRQTRRKVESMFSLPKYNQPDFNSEPFISAPVAVFKPVLKDGAAPGAFHVTSIFPEYFHLSERKWVLLHESRMDCVVVLRDNETLEVTEPRRLKRGDRVACGRGENGEEGIFVHDKPFPEIEDSDKFAFRTSTSRETSFSIDYDELYDLLVFERDNGRIVWVMGPAVVFDSDARKAFVSLIETGFVHALLAGNALAVHDVEGALFHTALGRGIYTKKPAHLGHYHHIDAINTVRRIGSLRKAVEDRAIQDGIMHAVIKLDIPFVLAGSIRDDGPLPEVIPNVYEAQDKMRNHARHATTVICVATQLHSIAVGNVTPSYHVQRDTTVRPVFFYCVDMSEFAVNKLGDRGSLTARSILTNAQDFIVTLERGLRNA